jgi:replicative superfamily II helicase
MQYSLDLKQITVTDYELLLKNQNLLPGRRILLEEIDSRLEAIRRMGVDTADHLKKELSTPQKLAAFADKSGIPEEYLVILKRELGSLEQKPVPLSSFPDIDAALLAKLEELGVLNSKDYLEHAVGTSTELDALCDLVRINGVGAVAARAFYEAGYRSAADVAHAQAGTMLARVNAVNEQKKYYNAKLGVKDMQFCIDFAVLLEKYSK